MHASTDRTCDTCDNRIHMHIICTVVHHVRAGGEKGQLGRCVCGGGGGGGGAYMYCPCIVLSCILCTNACIECCSSRMHFSDIALCTGPWFRRWNGGRLGQSSDWQAGGDNNVRSLSSSLTHSVLLLLSLVVVVQIGCVVIGVARQPCSVSPFLVEGTPGTSILEAVISLPSTCLRACRKT